MLHNTNAFTLFIQRIFFFGFICVHLNFCSFLVPFAVHFLYEWLAFFVHFAFCCFFFSVVIAISLLSTVCKCLRRKRKMFAQLAPNVNLAFFAFLIKIFFVLGYIIVFSAEKWCFGTCFDYLHIHYMPEKLYLRK